MFLNLMKVIDNRMKNILEDDGVNRLTEHQYGFRKGRDRPSTQNRQRKQQ